MSIATIKKKLGNADIETTHLINNVDNAKAQVIFAHGAGADMHHEFMEKIALGLNEGGINVLRFNFPFMDKRILLGKRYPPDRMPKLIECYQNVIDEWLHESGNESSNKANTSNNIRPSNQELPIFIGGKSMGSRVAVTLAGNVDQSSRIKGVFCLGYPFHPTKKPEELRLTPLQETLKPVLIVQGDRDTLGSEIEISGYDFSELCQCIFMTDGDHSLKPRVKSGFTQQQHIDSAVQNIIRFICVNSLPDNLT